LGKLLPYRTPHNDEVAVLFHHCNRMFLVKRIIGIRVTICGCVTAQCTETAKVG